MVKQLISTVTGWRERHPKRFYALVVAVVATGVYGLLFAVPRNLTFSYAEHESCITGLTFLPTTQHNMGDGSFSIHTEGQALSVGGVPLVSTKLCAEPMVPPKGGTTIAATAPFGGVLFRQHVRIITPAAPRVTANALTTAIPTTKAVSISLSDADQIHTYILRAEGKEAACTANGNAKAVTCDVPALGLQQGKQYEVVLARSFKQSDSETVLKRNVTTLTATTITGGSVKNDATVYNRPTTLTFTADKSLRAAKVIIVHKDTGKNVAVDTSVNGKIITAKLPKELARDITYKLTVTDVEAADGSALTDPYVIKFHMSGGPKVTGVSVGRSGVSTVANVVVTFDQALSSKQPLKAFANISGGDAQISRSGKQVVFSLRNMGLCRSFTLSIAKGFESKYDIGSKNAWSYSSRTICHTSSVYGYSVNGRALMAYTFGSSGPVTMYVGAIHGNEASSSGLMQGWMDDLETNPNLYGGKRVVLVPTINPDGVAAGTRTNARGVNLNRNFPTNGWVKDIDDTDGYHKGGGGSKPLSEPEASALANLTVSLRPRLLLSFHAVGSLVTGDPGGYSASYAATYASMVGYRNATGQSGTFDYDITGAYEDWTYTKQGIPSMVIELGSYGYYSFPHHQAALRAMLK